MLRATPLKRLFILIENRKDITLPDPDPAWAAERALNFYSEIGITEPHIMFDEFEFYIIVACMKPNLGFSIFNNAILSENKVLKTKQLKERVNKILS